MHEPAHEADGAAAEQPRQRVEAGGGVEIAGDTLLAGAASVFIGRRR